MKKTEKLLSVLLMVVMFITSAGLLYASIYASGGGTHSTFSSVVFEGETGIRYNPLTEEFEVFNEAGVSWIASNKYISVDGTVELTATVHSEDDNWGMADGNKIYNIMRDIAYTGSLTNQSYYNTDFDTNKITLGEAGVIDGRGFYLKDFRIKSISIDAKNIGTSLVRQNSGTIRNLNVANASFPSSESGVAAGIICGVNNGLIDSCRVYGSSADNSYTSDKFVGLYGIAAESSGRIRNSLNSANLINSYAGQLAYAAGLTCVAQNSSFPAITPSLLNNVNNGSITISTTGHAAGIAIDSVGIVFTVRGNTNNGVISSSGSASGIIDGGITLSNMSAKDNKNNGDFGSSGETNDLYYTLPIEIPEYGIIWLSTLNDDSGGFQVYNADGISWISSGAFFDETGAKADNGSGGAVAATSTSYYEIHPDIAEIDYEDRGANYNNGTGTFNEAFYGGANGEAPSILYGGVFNGNDNTLKNFPMRQCGSATTPAKYYSTLFYQNYGTIRNLTADINTTVSTSVSYASAGGIVGYMASAVEQPSYLSYINVNCMIDDTSDKVQYIGGVVGYIANSHYGNSSEWAFLEFVSVASLGIYGKNYVGGVFGCLYGGGNVKRDNGVLYEVTFTGSIGSAERLGTYTGGLGGFVEAESYATNCRIYGDIYGTYTGWAVGFMSDYTNGVLEFTDCESVANLHGKAEFLFDDYFPLEQPQPFGLHGAW